MTKKNALFWIKKGRNISTFHHIFIFLENFYYKTWQRYDSVAYIGCNKDKYDNNENLIRNVTKNNEDKYDNNENLIRNVTKNNKDKYDNNVNLIRNITKKKKCRGISNIPGSKYIYISPSFIFLVIFIPY